MKTNVVSLQIVCCCVFGLSLDLNWLGLTWLGTHSTQRLCDGVTNCVFIAYAQNYIFVIKFNNNNNSGGCKTAPQRASGTTLHSIVFIHFFFFFSIFTHFFWYFDLSSFVSDLPQCCCGIFRKVLANACNQ